MRLLDALRKRNAPAEKGGEELIGIFAIAIVIIIAFVVIALRLLGVNPYEQSGSEPTLEEIIDAYGYNEERIADGLRPHLDTDAVQSDEVPFVARDGQLRRAFISKPAGEEPFPAVILLHGAPAGERVTERFSSEIGERLAEDAGVLTVTVDWRDSDFGDGDLNDAVSVLDAVEKYTVDVETGEREPIIYVGVDHGAYLALLAAAEETELVKAVVAAYGYVDLAAQYSYLQQYDSQAAQNFLRDSGCDVAVNIQDCLTQRSISTELLQRIPSVMALHHVQDSTVPLSQSERLVELRQTNAAAQKETKLITLGEQDADAEQVHDMLSDTTHPHFDEAYAQLLDWLQDVLEPTLELDNIDASLDAPLEIDINQ